MLQPQCNGWRQLRDDHLPNQVSEALCGSLVVGGVASVAKCQFGRHTAHDHVGSTNPSVTRQA